MEKLERLDDYLENRDLASVWFARPNSFTWLTGGSNVIDRAADAGVAAIGYDGDELTLLTDNIEADRILDEECPNLEEPPVVERFPWHETSLEDALTEYTGKNAAADIDIPWFERVDPTTLRQPLTEQDCERYRDLGAETAAAVESVCHELRSEDTEHEVASALRVALSAREIEAPVILVGGSERATEYRHYTPKREELGDYALVSVTAQRDGLHASCTRTVAFDPPTWLKDRHAAATRVETTALAATQELATATKTPETTPRAGDVFDAIQHAYDEVGWDGEWELHHQGGAAGFAGREWIATPDHEAAVRAPMAYAWNPTIQGAKSEGTVLVTDNEFEPLTATGQWPTVTARAVDRDLELERPGILGIHDE
ncbi:M24 family metallopeptidase [Halostagnicola sp. A-GB9-2]|uniref:M24 family metallopeptidase n=1 Tax=Halostagnicola sp. A-GB9-2 TaxID=3048066 RepID=UPI0024C080B2|nr:M24 family metallopeptidase [Halostagnicola sp. A-GB9-2]MDJ1432044.1 M24 family metallopeptidase [Halostagnicola sp. A-GB9-2]